MNKRTFDDMTPDNVKAEWDVRADPGDAWNDLVNHGYDPDGEYVVSGTCANIFEPVFEGNLIECLTKASELSDKEYHVVMRKEDIPKIKQVQVH